MGLNLLPEEPYAIWQKDRADKNKHIAIVQ